MSRKGFIRKSESAAREAFAAIEPLSARTLVVTTNRWRQFTDDEIRSLIGSIRAAQGERDGGPVEARLLANLRLERRRRERETGKDLGGRWEEWR